MQHNLVLEGAVGVRGFGFGIWGLGLRLLGLRVVSFECSSELSWPRVQLLRAGFWVALKLVAFSEHLPGVYIDFFQAALNCGGVWPFKPKYPTPNHEA